MDKSIEKILYSLVKERLAYALLVEQQKKWCLKNCLRSDDQEGQRRWELLNSDKRYMSHKELLELACWLEARDDGGASYESLLDEE